jgi:hypothetical protein
MKPIRLFGIVLLFAVVASVAAFAATSGPSPVPPAPNFQITTPKQILCKGITNNVPITVTNFGNSYNPTMQDVQLSLNNRNLIETGNAISINTIGPSNSAMVYVPLFANLNASSLLIAQIPITYQYLTLYSDSEVRNLSFVTQGCPSLIPLMVNVFPSVLVSGQINNITFSFNNTGNTTLNSVSAAASIKGGQSGVVFIGRQPIQIESIPPKSTVSVTEGIYENSSQIFPLNLSVSFFNGTDLQQIADSFAMLSSGTIDLVPSSIAVSPSNLTQGSIFSVSFVVTDTGTIGVSDATATAVLPKGFKEYGTSGSTFIGSIATESQTPISLTLTTNSSIKTGNYIIPVEISYLNNLRQNLSTMVDVPVVIGKSYNTSVFVTSGPGGASVPGRYTYTGRARSGYSLYIEIGLVIVVVVLLVLLIRERKKTQKNRQPKPK